MCDASRVVQTECCDRDMDVNHRLFSNDSTVENRARLSDDKLDPLGGMMQEGECRDVCLVVAIQQLGIPLPITRSGPFRALLHGNPMLRPFGAVLVRIPYPEITSGLYVVHMRNSKHFVAVRVAPSGVTLWDEWRVLEYTPRCLAQS